MTKIRVFIQSYAAVLIGIGIIAVATMISGINYYNSEQVSSKSIPSLYIEEVTSNHKNETVKTTTKPQTNTNNSDVSINPDSQLSTKKTASSTQPQSTSKSTKKTEPVVYTISLQVNGAVKGSFTVTENANHCDALTTALSKGYISSLDMRYNASIGSNAVYVIDGIGDSSSVWWVYTVNGSSPPVGCSQLPVKDGDVINWKYAK